MVIKQKDTNKIALKLLEASSDDFISRDFQINLIESSMKNSIAICSDNENIKYFIFISLIKKYLKTKSKYILILLRDQSKIKFLTDVIERHCDVIVHVVNDVVMLSERQNCLVKIVNYDNYIVDKRSHWVHMYDNVSLLIVDDCHEILEPCGKLRLVLELCHSIESLHLLGLNPAIIHKMNISYKLEDQIQEMEALLHCHVDIGSQSYLQACIMNTIDEERIIYNPSYKDSILSGLVRKKLQSTIDFLNDVEDLYVCKSQTTDKSEYLYSYCLNSCLKCLEILDELGIWCCNIVARAFIRHLLRQSMSRNNISAESRNKNEDLPYYNQTKEDEIGRILRSTTSTMSEIVRISTVTFDGMSDYDEFQQVISPKVQILINQLKIYKPSLDFKIEAVKLHNLSRDSDGGSITPATSQESLDKKLEDYESDSDFDTSSEESMPTDDENPSVDRGGPTFRTRTFNKRKRSKRNSLDQSKSATSRFLFRAVVPNGNEKESDPEAFNKLCCLIYVNCSFTAYALSHFLEELCIWDPDLFFLHPAHVFTVSNPQNEIGNPKTMGSVSMGQEETINNFRKGMINCLITTQILDNAKFDLQKCNLVVRFDPILDLQQYFNTKSRAGVTTNAANMLRKANSSVAEAISHMADKRKAKMIHFIPEKNKEEILNNLTDFYNVEQGIVSRFNKISGIKTNIIHNEPIPSEAEIDSFQAPITSSGPDGKEITLSRAISLVNLYCARLPTDCFTKLTPDCHIEFSEGNGSKMFRCQLQLPINSPHRLNIHGLWMPYIELAKMSAALLTMEHLYKLEEVDNQFYPWNKEDSRGGKLPSDFDHNEENGMAVLGGGSSKCRHCYSRLFAKCISTSPLRPVHPCYLYSINIILSRAIPEEQNLKGRKLMISQNEDRGFGVLCGEMGLENTLTFPVFTRSGEEEVNFMQLKHDDSNSDIWLFSEEQFEKIKLFHHIMISSVFRLKLDHAMMLDLENADVKLLILPINKAFPEWIDWDFIDLVIKSYNAVENVCRLETRRKLSGMFDFLESDYRNAVVMPSYRNTDHRQYYYVADICWDMRPTTDFPGENFSTFAEYYTKKYQAKITNYQQPLLDADFSVMRLNLTTPRHVNFKGIPLPVPSEAKKKFFRESMTQKQFLIPELCYIHPFPATLWHKAACLPTVLHRANQLLLAEELRSLIARDTGLGPPHFCTNNEKLLMDYNLSGGLRNENENNMKISTVIGINLNETKIIEEIEESLENKLKMDIPRSDVDFGEFRSTNFLGENEEEYFESKSDVESDDSFEDDTILFLPEEDDVQYNLIKNYSNNVDDISSETINNNNKCPTPSVILEAITMLSVSDFVNLERMETVGDSFLKYASTVYNFLKYPYAHEGRLSYLRSKQVSNSNLYVKAKEKNLAGYLNSQKFSPQDNWMLPGYKYKNKADVNLIINESYSSYSPRIQHFLSDKNLADVVESLTGCYLTTRGEISALRLLQWFNIDCVPIDENLVGEGTFRATEKWIRPKSPLIGELVTPEHKNFYNELIGDLLGLETIIGYKFKEKAYLLQAMTHSSFYINTFTDCYQRLELLGDAVLDYVITRFLYEDCLRHSPGDLTDLRSALVNNNIFAALVVRFNIHKYFKCMSPDLWRLIDKFVFYQKDVMKDDLDFVIHQETRQGHNIQEDSINIDEEVEIPKCLGDIFESLAGAIYLDCGMDLNIVWKIFHSLFRERIERYTSLIPKSPVRQLLELMPEIVNFEFPKRTADGKTRVCVRVIGKGRFYGIGRNYRIAKSVAAKKALRKLLANEAS